MSDTIKSKEELEAMNKQGIIAYCLGLTKKFQEIQVTKIPERNVLMRMSSHFLAHMKRPNVARATKGKGKRPAKFLKWFNTEER